MRKEISFPVEKNFEGYEWTNIAIPPGITYPTRIQFDSNTHVSFRLSIKYTINYVILGMPVRYLTTNELALKLSKAKENGTIEKLIKELKGYEILLHNEFGSVPVGKDDARLIFQVIAKLMRLR